MSCANRNCNTSYKNDPHDSMGAIVVTVDGDFVCCQSCKTEYEEQRDRFFNETIHDSDLTLEWLKGKVE